MSLEALVLPSNVNEIVDLSLEGSFWGKTIQVGRAWRRFVVGPKSTPSLKLK